MMGVFVEDSYVMLFREWSNTEQERIRRLLQLRDTTAYMKNTISPITAIG